MFLYHSIVCVGQTKDKGIDIAVPTKGYAVLVRWWPGILACRNIRNNHSLRFPPLPKSSDLPFCFSNATKCSGGHFLPPDSGLGGSSDGEVAALEVFFFDPATSDFVLAIVGLILCMLRLVLSLTPTDKMASKTITITTSFFP